MPPEWQQTHIRNPAKKYKTYILNKSTIYTDPYFKDIDSLKKYIRQTGATNRILSRWSPRGIQKQDAPHSKQIKFECSIILFKIGSTGYDC